MNRKDGLRAFLAKSEYIYNFLGAGKKGGLSENGHIGNGHI
jgi:hypothetical protein